MNKFTRTALPLAIVMALAACQETPQETAEDVAEARIEAAEDTQEARQDYVEADSMDEAIDEREDLELAAAEGAYEIAKEQCDALTGEAKDACMDEAEAAYEAAKDAAQSGVGIAIIDLQTAETALKLANDELKRATRLFGTGIICLLLCISNPNSDNSLNFACIICNYLCLLRFILSRFKP